MPATGPTRPLPITDPEELRAALEGQDERERRVLEMRYGLLDGLPQSLARIGRHLGLSAERVRQLEARALARLGAAERPAPELRPNVPPPGGPARQRFLRPWTLMLLWLRPAHGAEVNERLGELGMPTADYRFLRRLEAEGLLESKWARGADVGPDRRVYALTTEGREQLERDALGLAAAADVLAVFFERWRAEQAV